MSAPSAPVLLPVTSSATTVNTTVATPCASLPVENPCGSAITMEYGKGDVQRLTQFTATVAGVPRVFTPTRTADGAGAQQRVDFLRIANPAVGIDPATGAPLRRDTIWMSRPAGAPTTDFMKILGNDPGQRSMESVLGDDIVTDGADNVFANAGSAATNLNNIERVSFLSPGSVTVTEPTRSGILIMDRGGNDNFRVAAVRTLDSFGLPATFGTTVSITTAQYGQVMAPIPSTVLRREPLDANYRPSNPVGAQPVSGVFVSYADLGVGVGGAVAGVSVVATDETDFSTAHAWKSTTNDTSTGGLDLLGGLLFDSVPDGTVTGRLYVDADTSGTDSAGDPGLGNTVVNLTGPAGNVLRSTTTGADGSYTFTGLAPFSYAVSPNASALSGVLVQPASEADPESGPAVLDGKSAFAVSSTSPVNHTGFSFGFTAVEQISGVTTDTQGTPIQSVAVTLLDATGATVLASTVTDATGRYTFAARPVGRYRVVQTQPANYLNSSPNQLDVETIFATASSANDFIELSPSGVISGAVRTLSGDPIPGVAISLTATALPRTTVTDAQGAWAFAALLPGSYRVTESQPAGYPEGTVTAGTNATSSVANTLDVTLATAGSSVGSVFVEGEPVGLISGELLRSSGTGLEGVTIELLAQGLVLRSTVTDARGAWAFAGLVSGLYVVRQAAVDPADAPAPTAGSNATLGADGFIQATLAISVSATSSSTGNVLVSATVASSAAAASVARVARALATTGFGAGIGAGIAGGALLATGVTVLLAALVRRRWQGNRPVS